jgi:hypothetical protein
MPSSALDVAKTIEFALILKRQGKIGEANRQLKLMEYNLERDKLERLKAADEAQHNYHMARLEYLNEQLKAGRQPPPMHPAEEAYKRAQTGKLLADQAMQRRLAGAQERLTGIGAQHETPETKHYLAGMLGVDPYAPAAPTTPKYQVVGRGGLVFDPTTGRYIPPPTAAMPTEQPQIMQDAQALYDAIQSPETPDMLKKLYQIHFDSLTQQPILPTRTLSFDDRMKETYMTSQNPIEKSLALALLGLEEVGPGDFRKVAPEPEMAQRIRFIERKTGTPLNRAEILQLAGIRPEKITAKQMESLDGLVELSVGLPNLTGIQRKVRGDELEPIGQWLARIGKEIGKEKNKDMRQDVISYIKSVGESVTLGERNAFYATTAASMGLDAKVFTQAKSITLSPEETVRQQNQQAEQRPIQVSSWQDVINLRQPITSEQYRQMVQQFGRPETLSPELQEALKKLITF